MNKPGCSKGTKKLSQKQKRALSKVTGRFHTDFNPVAVEAYFNFTDRGIKSELEGGDKQNFEELMEYHRQHPYTVETWKEDFRAGRLFLFDFLGLGYPEAYVEHAFEIYMQAMGYIPTCYCLHRDAPKRWKEIGGQRTNQINSVWG